MLPVDSLLVFWTASVLLALAPGPDNLFVLAQAMQHGRVAGLAVTLGLCTGLLGHTAAVALGVAALFDTSAVAFALLKYLGAAYLLYLAWQAFRAGATAAGHDRLAVQGFTRLYRRGIFMNLTNPKVSLFFLAFLPQFTDPARGVLLPQILLLGLLFIAATIVIFGAISLLAGSVGELLRRSTRAQLLLNRLSGLLFVGLAIRLALARR